MWICARCGTEAQQVEVCSGCGSLMKIDGKDEAKRPAVLFILGVTNERDSVTEFIGPFTGVLECDQWWAQHSMEARFDGFLAMAPFLLEAPT